MTTEELQRWWEQLDEDGRSVMLAFDPHGEAPQDVGRYTNQEGSPMVTTVGFKDNAPAGDSHYLEPAAVDFLAAKRVEAALVVTTVTPRPAVGHAGPYTVRLTSGADIEVPNLGGHADAYVHQALAHGSAAAPTDRYVAYRAVADRLDFA